jgi:hypothetical protein
MHRHASVEICKDKIYVHASLGGHPHIARPASYAQETKTYFKLGPLEVFRGLLNHSASLVSQYGTLDLMRAHDQSFCPGRFHVIFYLNLRQIRRDIKRRAK